MPVFSQTEASLILSQIEEVEALAGLSFPVQYRQHLLRYNGGRCSPDIFCFVENGMPTESCIDWFFAICDGGYNNLVEIIRIMKIDEERLPSHILPIAHDPGGNLIVISCGMNDAGKVYFWDHENEVDYSVVGDMDYSNMYLIADSFDEFLTSLQDE